MVKLCLSLTESTLEEALAIYRENRPFVDLCELRADLLKKDQYPLLPDFPDKVDCPVILTLRRRNEGGNFDGNNTEYTQIVLAALRGAYAFVDVDIRTNSPEIDRYCGGHDIAVIRSYHDYTGIPEGCEQLLRTLPRNTGEIPKLACMINTTRELFQLARIGAYSEHSRQIIVGMGDFGVPSRLLPRQFNTWLSYSTAGRQPAAPGHITPKEMIETYRFRERSKTTALFGIIGNPVLHTRSPALHNPAFRDHGIDGVYIPFPTDDPEYFLCHIPDLGGKGFSITVPHKTVVARMLTGKEDAVREIGACNTVIWEDKKKRWEGYNTDFPGFIAPLKEHMELGGGKVKTAAVIGAGGAARAVVYALVKAGIKPCVVNRTAPRAKDLAERYGLPWGGLDREGLELVKNHSDLIVQTTSAGMSPRPEADPWPEYRFAGREIVYECIYTPVFTRFLQRAKESGCEVITGDRMLRSQGEEQFRLFTGKRLNTGEARLGEGP